MSITSPEPTASSAAPATAPAKANVKAKPQRQGFLRRHRKKLIALAVLVVAGTGWKLMQGNKLPRLRPAPK